MKMKVHCNEKKINLKLLNRKIVKFEIVAR